MALKVSSRAARVDAAKATADACPAHPDAPVREFRADGPAGVGTYRFCVPFDGRMHLLGLAADSTERPPLQDQIRQAAVRAAEHLEGPCAQLSVAELEALQAAAHGLTVQESADVLDKSPETVKSQRNTALLKLHARNIAHAVCLATAEGVIDAGQVRPTERRRDPRVLPAEEFAVIAHSSGPDGAVRRSGRLVDASEGGITFRTSESFVEGELLVAGIVRAGERHGVSGLRLQVVAVRQAGQQVVHAAFLNQPPDHWLDSLATRRR
jgi:DNA-binding CsgD family transcriptional regulator